MTAALEISGISKSFGNVQVLTNVSLALGAGSITLLLGANGSGKSTLLRICAGLSRPDKGQRMPLTTLPGYAGHQALLYGEMSVAENLALHRNLSNSNIQVESILKEWELGAYTNTQLAVLSKGNQARISLARAFLHTPQLALLDEPTSALDERGVSLLKSQLQQLVQRTGSALIATHDIARLRDIADRIIVLKDGQISSDSSSSSSLDGTINYYQQSNR